MAKLADAADLKSADLYRSWGFKSPSGHQGLDYLFPFQSAIPWHFEGKAIVIGMSLSIRSIPVILLGLADRNGWILGERHRSDSSLALPARQ